jgi:hypothetical protein
VSRVSAARRRSTRKSKASLRLPASIASSTGAMRSRSRSVLRGEASIARKKTRSKSRSRKGKERDASSSLPWLADDELAGSFLEMEGRAAAAGEEEEAADAVVDVDEIGDGDDGSSSVPTRTGA